MMLNKTPLAPMHRNIEQRAGEGFLGRIDGAVGSGASADGHPGRAGIFHNGADIGKVQVNQAGDSDDFGNGLYAVMQHPVRNSKSGVHAGLLVAELQQAVVRDDDQSIGFPIRSAIPSSAFFIRCFPSKPKGLVTMAIVRAPDCFGNFRHDRGRTGTGAAAHAGGHEYHVCAFESISDIIFAFFCGFMSDRVVAAGAHAAGQSFSEL